MSGEKRTPLPTHYRYEDGDFYENPEFGTVKNPPLLRRFYAVRETPCGYWIRMMNGRERWVSKTSRKRYAYPSLKEAAQSYLQRKRHQVGWCKFYLKKAKHFLTHAERLEDQLSEVSTDKTVNHDALGR